MRRRLLFASIHSYLDPSSGAALATRELLERLSALGWDCRVLTCGVLDFQNETPLEDVLTSIDEGSGATDGLAGFGTGNDMTRYHFSQLIEKSDQVVIR